MTTTINPDEIEKFSKIAHEWWDETGKFKPLHKFNPTRIEYIKAQVGDLTGKTLLDVGCGGGLLSEPMARLGATVTGIDAAEKNIKTASVHAEEQNLSINYVHTSIEEHHQTYDIILNMEVVEHVENPALFMQTCADRLNPGGMMIVATLNRTLKSYALAIVGAEYILRWLPRGTHDWKKFLKPAEVAEMLPSLDLKDITGVSYNPLKDSWKTGQDVDVNYLMCFQKVQDA